MRLGDGDDVISGISELHLPTGLLFIPHVIHECGQAWWILSTEKNSRCAHQSGLWQSYKLSHLVADWEAVSEGNDGFCL
jgi:hypothetical protein